MERVDTARSQVDRLAKFSLITGLNMVVDQASIVATKLKCERAGAANDDLVHSTAFNLQATAPNNRELLGLDS